MLEFLKNHQLSIMLFMSGMCGSLALLAVMTAALSPKRRRILTLLELGAMLLLLADRQAYLFRGDVSTLGYWMVRVSNFLVYFLTLCISHWITLYLIDLYSKEGGMTTPPRRLTVCRAIFYLGVALLVISQFTGLYYTFDEQNRYQRSAWNLLCYAAPILIIGLQMSVVIQFRRRLSGTIVLSLLLNTALPVAAAVLQLFAYGLSLINMTVVGMAAFLYIFALTDLNRAVESSRQREIELLKEEQKNQRELFEQTAEALVNAIDAKDKYTNGHSQRVAEYSRKIAQAAGKNPEECDNVYFAALLHDVGKIGIPDHIINKEGKLTDEEFAVIRQHPVMGNQILSSIRQSPYLALGAHYHHERYGGGGYPLGLKGDDIPELARIIAVADAYDAMTSKRSYRETIPQQKVREELVKGMGTQFDPQFAKIMLHLLDLDTEYQMREDAAGVRLSERKQLRCERIGYECSEGVLVTDHWVRITFVSRPEPGAPDKTGLPTLVLYDSLDGQYHEEPAKRADLLYFEYGQLRLDGQALCVGARKIRTDTRDRKDGEPPLPAGEYRVQAVRVKDHMMVRTETGETGTEFVVALPDNTRFAYLSVTGEGCVVEDVRTGKDEQAVGPDYIPRIAPEISFIRDCPQGDVPNVQVDGWRTASSQGVPIREGMELRFHTMSLPTARLVWHCPFVSLFTSKDGSPQGESYRELVLIRLDGENWESDAHAVNKLTVNKTRSFEGWTFWKEKNREGLDCVVSIRRRGNVITVQTENLGIAIRCITTLQDDPEEVYAALTGDQCALTDIHVDRVTEEDPIADA